MSDVLQFFFDFRSPYSYLALSQLPSLGVDIAYRPMNVLAVMKLVNNTPTTVICKPKGAYASADLGRWAKKYGLTIKGADLSKMDAEAHLRAVLVAPTAVAGTVVSALFDACWKTGKTLTSSAEVVNYLSAAGVDTKDIAERIDSQAAIDALAANNAEAAERGVFGAPTMLIGKAMFFGNDRFEFVREYLASERAA